MNKDFDDWHALKSVLDGEENVPMFKQREIWWCSIGLNVGHESDGKNELYNRPVLVVRKFNRRLFLGVPLTTKIKDNPFYFPIDLHSKKQCIMIAQFRVWDAKRLHNKLGKLSVDQYNQVRSAMKDLI